MLESKQFINETVSNWGGMLTQYTDINTMQYEQI